MGMMDSISLLSVTTHNAKGTHSGEIIDTNDARMSYRLFAKNPKNSSSVTQVAKLNTADCSGIEALKEDIMYFRSMLAQMDQQKHEKTNCYASKSKRCNSALDGNVHKMHKKYLDLLNKTQANEARLHLRALEGELTMLAKYDVPELGWEDIPVCA